jgi:leader peptidase (prepilin peptidase)/N-methyltransferase
MLTAIMYTGVFSSVDGLGNALIGCVFCSVLLVVAFIDIDTMEICDSIVFGATLCGLAISVFFPEWHTEQLSVSAAIDSLTGMCFGSGLMLWIAVLGEVAFKREAVGFGDIKLMGMVGAFVGCKGSVFAIFGGCLIAMVVAIPVISCLRVFSRKNLKIPREVPFAPFIAVGSVAYVLFGQKLFDLLL